MALHEATTGCVKILAWVTCVHVTQAMQQLALRGAKKHR